jgi:hypothetical protein
MKTKERPKVGSVRWVVEWVDRLAFHDDDPDNGVDVDRCRTRAKAFNSKADAFCFAMNVAWLDAKNTFGVVCVESQTYSMEDDDLYPFGHWVGNDDENRYVGDGWEND